MERAHESAEIELGGNRWSLSLMRVGEDGFELTIARNGTALEPSVGWTETEQGMRTAVFRDGVLWSVPLSRWIDQHRASGATVEWQLHPSARIVAVVRDDELAARFTATQEAPREWTVAVDGPFRNVSPES